MCTVMCMAAIIGHILVAVFQAMRTATESAHGIPGFHSSINFEGCGWGGGGRPPKAVRPRRGSQPNPGDATGPTYLDRRKPEDRPLPTHVLQMYARSGGLGEPSARKSSGFFFSLLVGIEPALFVTDPRGGGIKQLGHHNR